jgi:uncharacterized protein (TIGR02246 family)
VRHKYVEAYHQNDAAAMAAVYADDAILLLPNDIIRGRKGIEKFWEAVFKGSKKDAVITPIELFGSGDTIDEVGNHTTKVIKTGQEPIELKGRYIVIYKQTASGWMIYSHIWND